MLLAIDSATPACSVALIDNDRIIAERHDLVGRGHAERLLPQIADLLQNRRPRAILVDCGPGSFTGIRVGISAAYGLAIGWNIPVFGFSSLAVMAVAANRRGATEVAAALQAGHGEVFVQCFRFDPFEPLDELRSAPPIQAAETVGTSLVVGSGASALIAARGHGTALDILPRAADVRLLPASLRRLQARPIYGRAPDAKPMT